MKQTQTKLIAVIFACNFRFRTATKSGNRNRQKDQGGKNVL